MLAGRCLGTRYLMSNREAVDGERMTANAARNLLVRLNGDSRKAVKLFRLPKS